MKRFYRVVALSGSLALAAGIPAEAQLVINEMMQSNIDLVFDDLNDFPDSWVELYNPAASAVSLKGYSLGVKDNASKAWALPDVTVQAGGHVIVYCDKVGNGMHTDFRLESGKGGGVWLFKEGQQVDAVTDMAKQPAPNVAYGRKTSGDGEWGYMAEPTPGAANCGKTVKKVLPNPVFSVPGRVAATPFNLVISLPDDAPEGTKIRVTTDGSEPTAKSAELGQVQVNKTTVVRAKLFCEGYISPRSLTQSYIFHTPDTGLPVVSMAGDSRYFSDNKTGILVEGSDKNNPNYRNNWRRPVNIEFFWSGQKEDAVVNQLIETRVKGGATRSNPLKSLALYANKRFGEKRLKHEFFADDAPGVTDWKSVELRNSGNDFDYMYFRDAAIQRVMGRHCDLDWQPWQPAVFYLNGEYKGILNIRPRSNDDFVYSMYDGLEDADVVENWWDLKTGNEGCMQEMYDFARQTGRKYAEFEQYMDTEEFCNLMIMNLYQVNLDFPGNNIVMWRPQAEGGRWRWIAKDTDFGLGLYGRSPQYKTLDWIYNNGYDRDNAWGNTADATRLFRRLMATPEFKEMFIDRCGVYMGDFLNKRGHIEAINEMYALIKEEYKRHRALYNPWWPNHAQEIANAKDWVVKRTPFFYTHVGQYFGLGNARDLTIDMQRSDDLVISINGIPLNYRSFDGKWWEGRTLKLTGLSPDGLRAAVAWEVAVKGTDGKTETTRYEGEELTLTFPVCQSVKITSIPGQAGVDDIAADAGGFDPQSAFEAYDLAGRRLGRFADMASARTLLQNGVYVVRQKGRTRKLAL